MAALQNVSSLQLRVEALIIGNEGRSIRSLTPDAQGYYQNIPVMALGVPTRNKTYYDVPSIMNQIESPTTAFNMRLVNSQLCGELGHPYIVGMPQDEGLARLAHIEEKNTSHLFGGFKVSDPLSDGSRLLLASVKPYGHYGEVLERSFRDPTANTGFSLRAISTQKFQGGYAWRTTQNLVTFDAVNSGGYLQASKLFVPATESLDSFGVDIVPFRDQALFNQVSLECFTDSELNDYFGAKKVGFYRHIKTIVTSEEPDYIASLSQRQAKSIFGDLIRE